MPLVYLILYLLLGYALDYDVYFHKFPCDYVYHGQYVLKYKYFTNR